MYSIQNLIIVGTSHIALQSVNEVSQAIEQYSPEIIALELDLPRFKKIISKERSRFRPSDILQKGFFLNLIGAAIEHYLGKKVGVLPGAEMKAAIELARKNKIKIALIDQDIRITLSKLKSQLILKEKLRIVLNILKELFRPNKLKIDLTKVPEQKLINKILFQVKKDYPVIYQTLVEDRDKLMASSLANLMQQHKLVIAVVGAGHIPGIIKELKWKFQKKK